MDGSSLETLNLMPNSTKSILILGRRGNGKSSLANLLATGTHWDEIFDISHNENSVPGDPISCTATNLPLLIYDSKGWDERISTKEAIADINRVTSDKVIHGIIFVLKVGRCDEWDEVVFRTYLQYALTIVPSSIIGVVFTHSPMKCVKEDSWDYYRSIDGMEMSKFIQALLIRCEKKLCFIDNPDPKLDVMDYDYMRKISVQNVCKLIRKFNGECRFDNLLIKCYKYYVKIAEEFRSSSVPTTIVTLLLCVLAYLTRKQAAIAIENIGHLSVQPNV